MATGASLAAGGSRPHGGGGWGSVGLGSSGEGMERGGSDGMAEDNWEDEAVRENLHAQQMMSLMRDPAIYSGLGLDQPPTSYTPGTEEDMFARVQLLLVDEAHHSSHWQQQQH